MPIMTYISARFHISYVKELARMTFLKMRLVRTARSDLDIWFAGKLFRLLGERIHFNENGKNGRRIGSATARARLIAASAEAKDDCQLAVASRVQPNQWNFEVGTTANP